MDGWLAQYIRAAYFAQYISYVGIPAQCILALGILVLGHSYLGYLRWVGLAGAGGGMLL